MDAVPPGAVFAVLMCWTAAVGQADPVFVAALTAVMAVRQAAKMRRGRQ